MNILAIDVGGSHVKFLVTGQSRRRKFKSGRNMAVAEMVARVRDGAADWDYDVISIGYPGPVIDGTISDDPYHLAHGWVGFDFQTAFGRSVRVMNDAAMQALGSYESGHLLFLGLGTGLGSAMVIDGITVGLELGHLPYKKRTYEGYLGKRGLKHAGKKKWRRRVRKVVGLFNSALQPTDIVLGGGNIKKLNRLPRGVRAGKNANAFIGGFRLWDPRLASGRDASGSADNVVPAAE